MKSKIVIPVLLAALVLVFTLFMPVAKDFSFQGKWKNIGETGFGQIYPGSVLVVNDTYCNLYSPRDTYAITEGDDDSRTLEITSFLFGERLNFDLNVLDKDNIELSRGSVKLELHRVE